VKPVRMGIIGAGGWGRMHARTYASTAGVQLTGVVDSDTARAEALAEEFDAKAYSDARGMLASSEIDAVSIVTPDFAHDDLLLDAVAAGKHILCEKPLAMTVEACERIVAAAEQAGILLMVDFHARWSPPIYRAFEALRGGEIGAPQHVYYRLNDRISVPTEMLSWADKSSVLWFVGSHAIDTVRWLLQDEAARVYCVSGRSVLKQRGIESADYYLSTLEFQNGATAVIENSWILPNTMPNIVDLKCQIVGSDGALYIDQSHNRAVEKYTADAGSYPDTYVMPLVHGRQEGFAAASIRHFVECVREGNPPLVTGRDGLEVTRVICALEESVRTRQPVEVR
jgi:predicted dehydrogenase